MVLVERSWLETEALYINLMKGVADVNIEYDIDFTRIPETKVLKGDKITIKMDGQPDISAIVVEAKKNYIKIDNSQ